MTPARSYAERLAHIKHFIDVALAKGDTPEALRLIREQREIEQKMERGEE